MKIVLLVTLLSVSIVNAYNPKYALNVPQANETIRKWCSFSQFDQENTTRMARQLQDDVEHLRDQLYQEFENPQMSSIDREVLRSTWLAYLEISLGILQDGQSKYNGFYKNKIESKKFCERVLAKLTDSEEP